MIERGYSLRASTTLSPLSAVFSGPFVISKDLVIEPNGREIRSARPRRPTSPGDKISAFRNYLDDTTLMEQTFAA